ncbi:VanZ family protein [Reinekea sp.]|jgi:VanZ family protein|uniref:VanZ family protein n=1 Tax=Reinekea sp. TaxID=1970455 RepID=UPI0039890C0C
MGFNISPQFISRIILCLLLVMVMVLSLAPVSQPDFSPNDKVNHFIAYGTLSFVGFFAFQRWFWVAIGLFCYGVLIECLQGMTEYRFASGADVVANSLGIIIGAGVYAGLYFSVLKNNRLFRN